MSQSDYHGPGSRGRRWALVIVGLAIAVGVVAYAFVALRKPVRGPELLNEPTKAREVRPFTTDPDPRFAPLPLEGEKHGK
jgi:hypothetical protein